jgi:hypothetical protein
MDGIIPTGARMLRIVVQGLAAVYRKDEPISDISILRSLDGLAYDDERFTDYLGGPAEEDALAAVLESGGSLRFRYCEGDSLLVASTEYRSKRPLSESELHLLVDYTMGQWSDGIGENWVCESEERCGFTVMCLTAGDGVPSEYPSVQLIEELAAN